MKKKGGKDNLILGLTGSIGMGKTTVAHMFKDESIPVFNSDDTVHSLYQQTDIIKEIEVLFPKTTKGQTVDRVALSHYITNQPQNLKKLEDLIHPKIRHLQQEFIKNAFSQGLNIVLIDSPLLFETGGEKRVDYTVVVSAGEKIQKQRVLARPDMNEEKLKALLARQMSDEEKKAKADFILDTGKSLEETKNDVRGLIRYIRTCLNENKNNKENIDFKN